MDIGVVTLFAQMFSAVSEHGISGRAVANQRVRLHFWNPRDYVSDRHGRVDDAPYGGGPGMVMQAEPLAKALAAARSALGGDVKTVCLSPQGRPLDQAWLRSHSKLPRLLLLCGRYEGIDERLIEAQVDEELSLGDFVISGGELAAMVVVDGLVRLLGGALGNPQSAERESFEDGLLDCPHYTRPRVFAGREVPATLLSGDHAAIGKWRREQSIARTRARRPDLADQFKWSAE